MTPTICRVCGQRIEGRTGRVTSHICAACDNSEPENTPESVAQKVALESVGGKLTSPEREIHLMDLATRYEALLTRLEDLCELWHSDSSYQSRYTDARARASTLRNCVGQLRELMNLFQKDQS